jgi:hypothetical protein
VEILKYSDTHQLILAMHPHGIVPFQAILWAAYCDQYFTIGDRSLYGFGAAADVVGSIPFLRNIMGFLAGGSASYPALKNGLVYVRNLILIYSYLLTITILIIIGYRIKCHQ